MKDKYREMVGLKRNPKRLKLWNKNKPKQVKKPRRPDVYS